MKHLVELCKKYITNTNNLILINRSSTPYDRYADLIINDNIGEVFSKIILE